MFLRKRLKRDWALACVYLILAGTERFLVSLFAPSARAGSAAGSGGNDGAYSRGGSDLGSGAA